MIHNAWRMPGTYPKIVSKMLSQNAPVNPTSRNTPNGGKIIAKMIFKMSMDFYSLVIVIERTITGLFMEATKHILPISTHKCLLIFKLEGKFNSKNTGFYLTMPLFNRSFAPDARN